jgi:hypothetical protein
VADFATDDIRQPFHSGGFHYPYILEREPNYPEDTSFNGAGHSVLMVDAGTVMRHFGAMVCAQVSK